MYTDTTYHASEAKQYYVNKNPG